MRWTVLAALTSGVTVGACSLFTSLDGYAGAPGSPPDGGPTAPDAPTADGGARDGASPPLDGGPPPDGAPPPNLVPNGSFETSDDSACGTQWAITGTATRVTGGHDGTFACRVCPGSNGVAAVDHWKAFVEDLAVGQRYETRVWVRTEQATTSGEYRLRIFDPGGAFLEASTTGDVSIGTAWQELQVTHTVAMAGRLNVVAFLYGAAPTNCFVVDDFRVTRLP